MRRLRLLTIISLSIASALLGACFILNDQKAMALSGSEFQSGRIIDDAVFFNSGSMNGGDVQNFFNSKVPTCDTNGTQPSGHSGYPTRADWGRANGYAPPYTCLKDYTENIPSKSADSYCGGSISGGTKSAAQILADVAQACGVSPKMLIVLLQKEQSLVTDDWPWSIQYRSATGYGCPDTAACDSTYYGYFNQVYSAARQYQVYAKRPDLFNYARQQTGFVQYNPSAGCGGSNIYMQNAATAGLYNYTPYQPNAAALANLYGTGDSCSAYGNRNFWRLFNDWFGSTLTNIPFAWSYQGQEAYSDAGYTQSFTTIPTVTPGSKLYVRVHVRNMGYMTWYSSNVHYGTSNPNDRISSFADPSWLATNRPAALVESVVYPGQDGTFQFAMKAPSNPGSYREYFNMLVENVTWFNNPGQFFNVNVVNTRSPDSNAHPTLASGETLHPGEFLLSTDLQSTLNLQADGNLVLYRNFRPVWSTGTNGQNVDRLVMQTDGNLVLYNKTNQALWNSGTNINTPTRLDLQTDANLVVYKNADNTARWATYTMHNPNLLGYVNDGMTNSKLYPGQQLETADRRYRFVLQTDGNLVLYSPNRATWNSGTFGHTPGWLAMQGDGNFVLYDSAGRALWHTGTNGRGQGRVLLQSDGNLIVFGANGIAAWDTHTAGVQ